MPDNSDDAGGRGGTPSARPAPPARTPVRRTVPRLIDDIARGALDPAYAEAARRRGDAAVSAARRAPTVLAGLLTLVLVGVLITTAAHRQADQAPTQENTRAALAAGVTAEDAGTRELSGRVAELDQEIRILREGAAADEPERAEVAGRVARLELSVGQAPALGPGVTLRLAEAASSTTVDGEDATQARAPRTPEPARILDHDIAELVNVLWAAGAEAIAVGGVRLTAMTAIRFAGATILVGFRPLTPPYVVEAIGDPERLSDALASSPTVAGLRARQTEAGGDLAMSTARELTLAPAPVTTPKRAGGLIP